MALIQKVVVHTGLSVYYIGLKMILDSRSGERKREGGGERKEVREEERGDRVGVREGKR